MNKKLLIVISIILLISFFALLWAGSSIKQNNDPTIAIGGMDSSFATGIAGFSIISQSNGYLQSIGVNIHSGSGNIQVALYDSNGYLIANSITYGIKTGWNDVPISANLYQRTPYIIAFQSDNLIDVYASNNVSAIYANRTSFGEFSKHTSFVGNSFQRNMRINYLISYMTVTSTTIIATTSTTILPSTKTAPFFNMTKILPKVAQCINKNYPYNTRIVNWTQHYVYNMTKQCAWIVVNNTLQSWTDNNVMPLQGYSDQVCYWLAVCIRDS